MSDKRDHKDKADALNKLAEVASGRSSDTIERVLIVARETLRMDVAFISEFTEDQMLFRKLSGDVESFRWGEGQGLPLTRSFCKPVRQSQLYDTLATVMGRSAKEAPAPEEKQRVTRHSLKEVKARSRARLFVAEDNQENQKVAVRILERLGYQADMAANGLEAVEALSHIPYSAVLMGAQMHEVSAYEATKDIRHREKSEGRHTPIIAMTANTMQGDREKALEAGIADYISAGEARGARGGRVALGFARGGSRAGHPCYSGSGVSGAVQGTVAGEGTE